MVELVFPHGSRRCRDCGYELSTGFLITTDNALAHVGRAYREIQFYVSDEDGILYGPYDGCSSWSTGKDLNKVISSRIPRIELNALDRSTYYIGYVVFVNDFQQKPSDYIYFDSEQANVFVCELRRIGTSNAGRRIPEETARPLVGVICHRCYARRLIHSVCENEVSRGSLPFTPSRFLVDEHIAVTYRTSRFQTLMFSE